MVISCTSGVHPAGTRLFIAYPTISSFDAMPNTITAGQSAILFWNVVGVTSVNIDLNRDAGCIGAQTVTPLKTTVYTITATNFLGTVSKSVVITVNPQPISITFEANPATIMSGGYATLLWNVNGATSVSIDQTIGQVPPSGNKLVNPTATTSYTLTASNVSGTITRSVTLVVNPPIVATFTASPTTTFSGQGTTLQWNVTGANTVSIDPDIGTVPLSGSRTVNPYSTTTYTLVASSDCCVASKSVTVTVGRAYPTPYPSTFTPFIEIFTVSPASIHVGQTATISWYVVGANSIYLSGIGYVSYSGSVSVTPATTTSYTMQASNSYAIRTRTITVVVTP